MRQLALKICFFAALFTITPAISFGQPGAAEKEIIRIGHARNVSQADGSTWNDIVVATETDGAITFQLGRQNKKFHYDVFECRSGSPHAVLAGEMPLGGVPSFTKTYPLDNKFFSLDYFTCNRSGAAIWDFPLGSTNYAIISCDGGLACRLFFHLYGIVRPGFCPCASMRSGTYAVLALKFLEEDGDVGPSWKVTGIRVLEHREETITGYTESSTIANWETMKAANYTPEQIEFMCAWLRAKNGPDNFLIIRINRDLVKSMIQTFIDDGRVRGIGIPLSPNDTKKAVSTPKGRKVGESSRKLEQSD